MAIDGFDRYRTYYKDLFDKLGVEVNLFRVGAYKSAAEVYIRKDMSPEDREESLAYLNAPVAELPHRRGRGAWPQARRHQRLRRQLRARLLAAKGDGAKVALDAKLVTGLKSSLEVEHRLVELVGSDYAREEQEQGRGRRKRRRRVIQLHLARGLPAHRRGREEGARRRQAARSA